jgi:uncharacterized coiled-coil DUF342 family protein
MNITGITAIRRVLSEVSHEEANTLASQAQKIENKMAQAFDLCKANEARKKLLYEGEINGDALNSIEKETIMWLGDAGPKVMQSLKDLEK